MKKKKNTDSEDILKSKQSKKGLFMLVGYLIKQNLQIIWQIFTYGNHNILKYIYLSGAHFPFYIDGR